MLLFRVAARQAGAGRMIGWQLANSAIVVVCWDNGGAHLVGLMVVRRSDGHACFVELPPELERRLATLDRQFVEDNAAQLLNIAHSGLSDCEFEEDQVISRDFLRQGHEPAAAGTMRHIPSELIAGTPSGIPPWQSAGFIVDVGEIDLAPFGKRGSYH
jgi:hypothetical protein